MSTYRWKPVGGLVVLAAALAAAGCGSAGRPVGPGTAVSPGTSSANRRAAEAEITALLADVRLPAGAVRLNAAPIAFLDEAPQTEASPNFITVTSWWSVDMPYGDAAAWVRAHPPGGLPAEVGGSYGGPGVPNNVDLGFGAPGTRAYTGAEVLIELASMGGRTGIRVDADAIWLPAKSPLELVPSGTPVTLVARNDSDGPGAQTLLTRRLDPADGNAVIADLDELTPDDGGTRNCAADTGYRVLIEVVVQGSSEVFDDFAACNLVLVDRGATSLPTLTDSTVLQNEIEHLMGPPPAL